MRRPSGQPDLAPTLPRFAGLDYSRPAVPVCILDTRRKILGNHACPDTAWHIDEAVRRFGGVPVAALESCAGAVSTNEVTAIRERCVRRSAGVFPECS